VSASLAVEQSWPAEAASVPAARRFVRAHLAGHELHGLTGDAELLVTELVSNVVLHVGGTVRVRVIASDGVVRLEVSDESSVPPLLRSFSATSSTGRGMRLVHSQSAEHGVRTDAAGKTIWVRLTPATAGRSDDELASAFSDVDWLAELDDGDGDADGASAPRALLGVRPARASLLWAA
jgi:anti-sigma regulatory factor (Ser/Thr protein kinase)